MAVSPTGTLPPRKDILTAGRDLLRQARQVPLSALWAGLVAFARAERRWLWVIIPFLAAWIQPFTWLGHLWGDIFSPLSFQPLVPFLVALTIWTRRNELRALHEEAEHLFVPQSRMRHGGLGMVVLGCVLLLLAHLTRMPLVAVFGLLMAAVGVIYRFYGLGMLRALTLPLLFLLTMIPPPETLVTIGTRILQFGTAPATGTIVRKLGLYNSVQGTFINFPTHAVEVTERLSGAPLVLPAMIFALWLSLTLRVRIGYAALLTVVAGASVMVINVVRLGLMGLVGGAWPAGMYLLRDTNPYLFIALGFYLTHYLSQALGLPEKNEA